MFNGNKLVLILPAILMALMFWGGYHFLGENEALTHEQLEEEIEINVVASERGEDWLVKVNWDWTAMPEGGLYGDDYVSITVLDESGKAREDVSLTQSELELIYADEIIYQTEGETVTNGVIFAYPNQFDEHKSYGNLGQAVIRVNGENIQQEDISVQMLHTWINHSPLTKEDAQLTNPDFSGAINVPYWLVSVTP
ncbi:hypothetical protein RYX56_02320 [Alkalihalophilus lindianensis]|uniref:Uncharacterized protein n=1 Tax=Alkalihalophilus lindianensis TaxID=1630542 RepID=A0ABU3X5M6_9BACI|nr:hypothetical protein [Alkalihalophilus lindianensis]MDV2683201.1 hypothetical protein [Alkalihalophilus lindianensis]